MIELQLQFSSLAEFLQMGGRHTFHVWLVYALFTAFIAYNLLMPLRQRKQILRQQAAVARRESQRNEARRRAQSSPAAPDQAGDNASGH